MRDDLEALLRQSTLMMLALAIALGWSLFQVARGVSDLVTGLLTTYPKQDLPFAQQALTWVIGGRVLTLTSLVAGLVELAVVVLVAIVVGRLGVHAERDRPDVA